jgi:hypothetical protein
MAGRRSCKQDGDAEGEVNTRSLSISPPRRPDPPIGKLQLVALGNRFCLARQPSQPVISQAAAEHVEGDRRERSSTKSSLPPPGRGDSIERRSTDCSGWPAALRSRSSSDERSIHRYPHVKKKTDSINYEEQTK